MNSFLNTYDNGMRLVFKKVEKDRPATIAVYVNTGSVNETEKNNGISHLIEHLTFKGTQKRTAKQISIQFEDIGANANAYTGKYSTCYFATVLPENIENCFEIISDIVLNSKFLPSEIEKEKKVIFEEIDMYQDDPETVCAEEFDRNFFGDSSLAKTILGTKESLQGITREDILEYRNKYYTAPNIVVSVVGGFEYDQIKTLTKKYFVNYFKQKAEVENICKSNILIPDKKFSFVKKDVAQTQIFFGFPCDNVYGDDKMAILLLTFIFGGGMGSRLFQKIREEKGLVYSVSCMPNLNPTSGSIVISFGSNESNAKEALLLIKKEIELLKVEGFFEEELLRAKNFCKSMILSSSELGADIARKNAKNVTIFGKVISPNENLEEINSVELFKLNENVKKIFNFSNVCGAVVSKNLQEDIFDVFD